MICMYCMHPLCAQHLIPWPHVYAGGEGTAEGKQRPVEIPPMLDGASSVSEIPPATDEYVTHATCRVSRCICVQHCMRFAVLPLGIFPHAQKGVHVFIVHMSVMASHGYY